MTIPGIDLTVNRTPSGWRRLLKTRVRRLSTRKPADERRQALAEIAELAVHALAQHDTQHR